MKIDLGALQQNIREEIKARPHTVTIVCNRTLENPPREVFQWRDNLGTAYSPALANLEECQSYPQTNGLNPLFE
jgi:hypothetical protein